MNKLSVILTSALLLSCSQTLAQKCKPSSIISSNSGDQFIIQHELGTVIDARTGLEWSLCSLGQTWENGNCLAAPTHFDTFEKALVAADKNTLGDNFRLPNIKELASIVERSCTSPAIDLTIFSSTLNAIYYSSTPDEEGNLHFLPKLGIKIIDFTNGSEFVPDVSKFRYVRLVRAIQAHSIYR